MVVGVKKGYYTGVVEKDYGAYKSEIIKEICAAKGGTTDIYSHVIKEAEERISDCVADAYCVGLTNLAN